MLTKQLAGHRGFLRHMTSGGSGMTSVFEITTLDVKKAPHVSMVSNDARMYMPCIGDDILNMYVYYVYDIYIYYIDIIYIGYIYTPYIIGFVRIYIYTRYIGYYI